MHARLLRVAFALVPLVWAIGLAPASISVVAAPPHHLDCRSGSPLCTEVHDSEDVFGEDIYVGHDEPSVLFYSNRPSSGNQMRYVLTLPTDPPATPLAAGKTFNFQLHPAFWVGMAMCDTQSYPLQVSTCAPDSDANITTDLAKHPGTAFMEMQFYPPGWAPWPAGTSCDATKWCAALNIDSLSEDPINGTTLNPSCAAVTGLEYVNFAFITKDGTSQAPANPVQSTVATFTPDSARDLFMNAGDVVAVTLADTDHGLRIDIVDRTTNQRGSMTASAANGFGQVKYAPTGTSCTNIPYDFHPMYSTSSEQTRVPWAAHSYNVAFSDEIGHFDYCTGTTPIIPLGNCPSANKEGAQGDQEPADGDDTFCFPASASTRIPIAGCQGTNTGFDGLAYQSVWPDGNTSEHPTSFLFTSPRTGEGYDQNYERVALEADLPRIEGTCNRSTGAGCTLIPVTDDGTPAAFYPFFSTGKVSLKVTGNGVGGGSANQQTCAWALGNDIAGFTQNDFGKNNQYGALLSLTYLAFGGNGATIQRDNNFRQVLSSNPCLAGKADDD
jgi:hypothetical protein